MTGDVFGNLRDWGQVLAKVGALCAERRLDEHQNGLVRILRDCDNWRLRRAVLQCVDAVGFPSDALLDAVLRILESPEADHDERVLAAEALAVMVLPRENWAGPADPQRLGLALAALDGVLAKPQAPVLHRALRRVRDSLAGPLAVGEPACTTAPRGCME